MLAGLPPKLTGKARIADLYAGLGTLSFPLSARARVTAYEGAPDAVAALDAAARHSGGKVQAVRRDLSRQPLMPKELDAFAAVVLDPPFAGAADQMPLLARTTKLERIIYVSCNPAALGRDAKLLQGPAGGWPRPRRWTSSCGRRSWKPWWSSHVAARLDPGPGAPTSTRHDPGPGENSMIDRRGLMAAAGVLAATPLLARLGWAPGAVPPRRPRRCPAWRRRRPVPPARRPTQASSASSWATAPSPWSVTAMVSARTPPRASCAMPIPQWWRKP
ncbi:hypothetical protein ACFQU7_19535 [Pseudoroseomonas wenyumeiae]